MRPIWWLLIAEIMFFIIGVFNIAQGVAYIVYPEYVVSYIVIFAMFFTWYLDRMITWIFITNKVTVDDLLEKK
jgi:hypothetical protein